MSDFGYVLEKVAKNVHQIREQKSENVIVKSTPDRVMNIYRKLKTGTGFMGWTPGFICEKVQNF